MTYYKTCPTCNGWLTLKDACVSNSDSFRCPDCSDFEIPGLVPVAEGAIIIEDGEFVDTTWYCARFGIAGYDEAICVHYRHQEDGHQCGKYGLVPVAAAGEGP